MGEWYNEEMLARLDPVKVVAFILLAKKTTNVEEVTNKLVELIRKGVKIIYSPLVPPSRFYYSIPTALLAQRLYKDGMSTKKPPLIELNEKGIKYCKELARIELNRLPTEAEKVIKLLGLSKSEILEN